MADTKLIPHKITKPIQLLAAWLAGLAIVNGSFLTAATAIQTPNWAPGLLVIAAVCNVPIFLLSLFLLQTKFRPEMQEDSYYAGYLERRDSKYEPLSEPVDAEAKVKQVVSRIMAKVSTDADPDKESQVVEILTEFEVQQLTKRFELSRSLSELYLNPHLWKGLVASWGDHDAFKKEISELLQAGLIQVADGEILKTKLTTIGEAVAKEIEISGKLWNHTHKRSLKK